MVVRSRQRLANKDSHLLARTELKLGENRRELYELIYFLSNVGSSIAANLIPVLLGYDIYTVYTHDS